MGVKRPGAIPRTVVRYARPRKPPDDPRATRRISEATAEFTPATEATSPASARDMARSEPKIFRSFVFFAFFIKFNIRKPDCCRFIVHVSV